MDAAVGEKQRYLAHLLQWNVCYQLMETLNASMTPYPWKAEKLSEIQKIHDTLREYNAQFFEKMMKCFENPDADPDRVFDGSSLALTVLIMADYPDEKVDQYLANLKEVASVLDSSSPEMVLTEKMKMLSAIANRIRQERAPIEKLPVMAYNRNPTPQE